MRLILNLIWFVLAGVWLAIGYLLAAVLLTLTIIGIPFAVQSIKLGTYALWPFGRTLVKADTRNAPISFIGNILWFVLAGWWIALTRVVTGVLLCLTIIGIPLGIGDFKMAGATLAPFGRQIVRRSDLQVR
jgi:uncharacterized membrane protein YccF (DUF307 family)